MDKIKQENEAEIISGILSAIYINNLEYINEIYQQNTINIKNLKDKEGSTVLYVTAQAKRFDIFKFLLDQEKKISSETDFKNWINVKNSENMTVLHLVILEGLTNFLEILLDNGIAMEENSEGIKIMHYAAQVENIKSLIYLKEKGFNLEEKDKLNGTPLHWACYTGREFSVYLLTSWNVQVNCADSQGLTPLHLAVMSGNVRCVKRMLTKGANRLAKDEKGKTPIDHWQSNTSEYIKDMLTDSNILYRLMNINPKPRPPSGRSFLISLMVIIGLGVFMEYCLVLPYIPNKPGYDYGLIIPVLIFGGLSILFFLISWLKNPGYLQKKEKKLIDLVLPERTDMVCFDCEIWMPPRSRHCDNCQKCVMVYDHHCPWINNCVGAGNHAFFFTFICCMDLLLIFTFISNIVSFRNHTANYWGPLFEIFKLNSTLYEFKDVLVVIYCVLCGIFLLPISALIYVQFLNLIKNRTTTERFGHSARHDNVPAESVRLSLLQSGISFDKMDNLTIPSKGCPKNCIAMCCTNSNQIAYKKVKITIK